MTLYLYFLTGFAFSILSDLAVHKLGKNLTELTEAFTVRESSGATSALLFTHKLSHVTSS